LNLQFNLLGLNRYVANAVAIGIVTGWNFWLNLRLSWRVTAVKPEVSEALAEHAGDSPRSAPRLPADGQSP
jgi:hypothetical protein